MTNQQELLLSKLGDRKEDAASFQNEPHPLSLVLDGNWSSKLMATAGTHLTITDSHDRCPRHRRTIARPALTQQGLTAASTILNELANICIVVAFVQAQMLSPTFRWPGTVHLGLLHGGMQDGLVVTVGAAHLILVSKNCC
jgi:hypothetical protein